MANNIKDYESIVTTGTKFGSWTVIKFAYRQEYQRGRYRVYFECLCICGFISNIRIDSLGKNSNQCVSCKLYTHNMSYSREYKSWENMIAKCNQGHGSYGKFNIKYEPRWALFINFYEDMGPKPEGYFLMRNDPLGDFSRENCIYLPKEEYRSHSKVKRI